MNCVELQHSLAEVEDGGSLEQRAHLMTCPACSALVKELRLIVAAAGQLQAADEPSPRVWNSIAAALRQEGLVRPQVQYIRNGKPPVSSFAMRWGAARWLVPSAAMLLLALGIYVRHQALPIPLTQQASVAVPVTKTSDLDDDELMQEIAANAPAMRGQYADNLRLVNESIRDAQSMVDESPNDPEARRLLMDAYQQKSMLYEMAMEHSLP